MPFAIAISQARRSQREGRVRFPVPRPVSSPCEGSRVTKNSASHMEHTTCGAKTQGNDKILYVRILRRSL